MCPHCLGLGENSVSKCDAFTINFPCEEWLQDPVCTAFSSKRTESNLSIISAFRWCMEREMYHEFKTYCETPERDCTIAMCETSGCKAEFLTSGIQSYLRERIFQEIMFTMDGTRSLQGSPSRYCLFYILYSTTQKAHPVLYFKFFYLRLDQYTRLLYLKRVVFYSF